MTRPFKQDSQDTILEWALNSMVIEGMFVFCLLQILNVLQYFCLGIKIGVDNSAVTAVFATLPAQIIKFSRRKFKKNSVSTII